MSAPCLMPRLPSPSARRRGSFALAAAGLLLAGLAPDARAAEHACAADARRQAEALLVFHTGTDRPVLIDDAITVLPPIANPAAPRQRFDVLQAWGHLYKATYRIRLLYARVPGPCVLVGEEILDHARL